LGSLAIGIHEGIARRSDGSDEVGIFGVIPEFFSERGDMHIDGSIEDLVVSVADFLEELFAGFDPTDGANQGEQEVEFDGGKQEGLVAENGLSRGLEDAQRADLKGGVLGFAWGELGSLGAPGDGAESGQQFAAGERFGQIIICAQFESDDAVGLLASGGEHEDWDVACVADAFEDLESIHPWKHQIEKDRLPRLLEGERQAFGSGVSEADAVAEGVEVA
jgi:hypothetical protein